MSVETDEQWHALCEVIGASDLAGDPHLESVDGRRRAHDLIDARIGSWARELRGTEAAAALRDAGVPASPFVQLHELNHLPEVERRGLYEDVDTPAWGPVPIIGYPVRYERGPSRLHRRAAPRLGEHNRDILTDLLGLSDEEIDRLEADGVIGDHPAAMSAW